MNINIVYDLLENGNNQYGISVVIIKPPCYKNGTVFNIIIS